MTRATFLAALLATAACHGSSSTATASAQTCFTLGGSTTAAIDLFPPDGISDLDEFLGQLIAPQKPQVMVEVKILAVDDSFTQDIGIDFNFAAPLEEDVVPPDGGEGDTDQHGAAPGSASGGAENATYFVPQNHNANSHLAIVNRDFMSPFSDMKATVQIPFFGCVHFAPGLLEFPQNVLPTTIMNLPPYLPSGYGTALLTYGITDDAGAQAIVNIIQQDALNDVFQAPNLVVYPGQNAAIMLDDFDLDVNSLELDFKNGVQMNVLNPIAIFGGLTLDVVAVPSADRRYVRLTLRPGTQMITYFLSTPFDIGSQQADLEIPLLRRSTLKTDIRIQDGSTVVIGGFQVDLESPMERGVPLLQEIPYLGSLFRKRTTNTQSLLLMVTPRIINQPE